MDEQIQQLLDAGQSVWLDDLSRDLLISVKLEQLIDTGVRGVTSNLTILGRAIAHGTDYDDAVAWFEEEYRGAVLGVGDSRRAGRARPF